MNHRFSSSFLCRSMLTSGAGSGNPSGFIISRNPGRILQYVGCWLVALAAVVVTVAPFWLISVEVPPTRIGHFNAVHGGGHFAFCCSTVRNGVLSRAGIGIAGM